MIALLLHAFRSAAGAIAEGWRFTVEVIEDVRATRAEIEKQYGPLGF